MTKRSIEISDFDRLPLAEQVQMLHDSGTYIGKRKEGQWYFVLLQLSGFYVEIRYKSYRVEIESIRSTSSVGVLDPYLNQVHVRDIDRKKKDKDPGQ